MKKLISLLAVFTLLLGTVAMVPVSAGATETLDDHLISHWDFDGDNPLVDKASNGSVSDTMKIGGSASASGGTAYIPEWKNANSNHYLYVEDSADLMRTTSDRTIYVRFMSDKGSFNTDTKADFVELIAQDGAMRVGINGESGKLFGSTNAHAQSENGIDNSTMPVFVANTWATVVISWKKDVATGEIVVTAGFKQGDSEWYTSVKTYTDTAHTWLQDDSDTGVADPDYLSIGRRTFNTASTWGGSLTLDDIRIYDKALSANEIKAMTESSRNIDDYLVTHWDFVGSNPLADKAKIGTANDLNIVGAVTVSNGTAYIKDHDSVSQSINYLYAEEQADLFRTTEDRTVYFVVKSDKGDFANDGKNDNIEFMGQNGAMRIGINADSNKLFASTNSHTQGENAADATGMDTFVKDTWTTVAISWKKDMVNKTIIVTAAFKVGDGEWVTTTISRTDANQTWFEDNSDSGANDTENFIIGRRTYVGQASSWGGNLTFDDIRVYNCALTADEMKSITISNDNNDPATPGEGNGSVENRGHSLSLADDIGINFYVEIAEAAKADATVKITKGMDELFSGKVSEATPEENGYYKFTGRISAKEMSDTVTITIKDANETVIYTNSYSAKAYIDYVIENKAADTKLVALVKAMANYGAYTQIRLKYNVENLANAGLADADKVLASVEKQDLGKGTVSGAVDGITYFGATLDLADKTHVVFAFSVDAGITLNENSFVGASAYDYNASKGNLQVKSEGLCAQNLATEQVVTVKIGDQTVSVAYSPLMYIMNNVDHADENQANVVKALYAYYLAATAYVAN